MWRELWEKHRRTLVFAVGMVCFFGAGVLARALPSFRERLTRPTELPRREAPAKPAPSAQVEPAAVENSPPVSGTERPAAGWYLYVTGAVRRPGIYRLPEGARAFHLVDAAGGLNDLADPVAVNLAAPLTDGAHVHVPRKGERPEPERIAFLSPVVRSATPASKRTRAGLIDINRASEEGLTALRGIGPALAKRIVEYRAQNGFFRTIDDLAQVKGIGPAKVEGLRGQATVGP